jgi:pentachlorophenol monooxygenase/3-(3-hydroxy-phenyl)propionate hydroxylase
VAVAGRPEITRLRELARSGFTVLLGDDAPAPTRLPEAPIGMHRMRDLDPGPTLREALGARPDEAWLLRPDAHVAAVVTSSADLTRAVSRVLALPSPVPA